MDVHVRFAITSALRRRGVDVLTAQDDSSARLPDPELLDRAGALGRVLFSRDEDLLAEATRRQRSGEYFFGLIYAHQLRVTVGQCVNDIELIAKALTPDDIANHIEFLPLR
jgi:hypothetical protein